MTDAREKFEKWWEERRRYGVPRDILDIDVWAAWQACGEQADAEKQALREQVRVLREALERTEWEYGACGWMCPWCRNSQVNGHARDCIRQTALAAANMGIHLEEK